MEIQNAKECSSGECEGNHVVISIDSEHELTTTTTPNEISSKTAVESRSTPMEIELLPEATLKDILNAEVVLVDEESPLNPSIPKEYAPKRNAETNANNSVKCVDNDDGGECDNPLNSLKPQASSTPIKKSQSNVGDSVIFIDVPLDGEKPIPSVQKSSKRVQNTDELKSYNDSVMYIDVSVDEKEPNTSISMTPSSPIEEVELMQVDDDDPQETTCSTTASTITFNFEDYKRNFLKEQEENDEMKLKVVVKPACFCIDDLSIVMCKPCKTGFDCINKLIEHYKNEHNTSAKSTPQPTATAEEKGKKKEKKKQSYMIVHFGAK